MWRWTGGLWQRDLEYSVEKAVGQVVRSKRTGSELSASRTQEYAAFGPRELSREPVADLCIATVYEPLRRWGNKTGVLCVWAICEEGRKGLRSLSTTNRESSESCVEVRRALGTRGRQTPGTIPPAGAGGLTKASDTLWPTSLRIRWWVHKMQNLPQQVPALAWPECKAGVVDRRAAPTVETARERRQASVAR